MIGGIIMIFVALWIYQSVMKAKMANVMMWVAGAALVFFVTQYVLIEINVDVFDLDGTKTESTKMLNSNDEACKTIETDKATSKSDAVSDDMGRFKDSSCSLVHGEDRQDKERYLGFSGTLKALYFELFPSIIGLLLIAFLRVKFITKEKITVFTLFGGIKEVFQGIKHSFKAPE